MKRRLMLLLATAAVLPMAMAAPASAKQPLRGEQVMTLNQDDQGDFGLHGCSEISWFGTVVFDETTYGMALYPIGSVFPGKTQHWDETWKIFAGEFEFDVVKQELVTCHPGAVVMEGSDSGVIAFANPKFHSLGVVEDASPSFEEWIGRKLRQDGEVGIVSVAGLDDVFGFSGSIRLN